MCIKKVMLIQCKMSVIGKVGLRDWWSFSEVVFVGQCEALVCLGFA